MKSDMILMLVVAFLLGVFFEQMMGSVCSKVEGLVDDYTVEKILTGCQCPTTAPDLKELDVYRDTLCNASCQDIKGYNEAIAKHYQYKYIANRQKICGHEETSETIDKCREEYKKPHQG